MIFLFFLILTILLQIPVRGRKKHIFEMLNGIVSESLPETKLSSDKDLVYSLRGL